MINFSLFNICFNLFNSTWNLVNDPIIFRTTLEKFNRHRSSSASNLKDVTFEKLKYSKQFSPHKQKCSYWIEWWVMSSEEFWTIWLVFTDPHFLSTKWLSPAQDDRMCTVQVVGAGGAKSVFFCDWFHRNKYCPAFGF